MAEQLLVTLEKVFSSQPLLGLVASYAAGVLVSFSPCIYPLIPITIGITGASAATTKMKGFIISFIFVAGVACIYTALGIFSALTGLLTARILINPVAFAVLAVIFLLLGLSYFGFFTIALPAVSFRLNTGSKKNLFALFTLGIASGLAIIPCNFPVLGAILSLIARKKSLLYGGLSLFLFSFGYGTILIVLGTFTTLIRRLPKRGLWLIIIYKGVGVIFILMSLWFFYKLFAYFA